MTIPYANLIYVFVAGISILLLAWVFVRRMQKRRNIPLRDASLTVEELQEHARSMSMEHAVSLRKNRLNWPIMRMNDSFGLIRQTYRDLNENVLKKQAIPPAAEWLLDNFYVIEEQVNSLRSDLSRKSYSDLPVLVKGPDQGTSRMFSLATELVAHTHGQIKEETLLKYLEAYQSHSILFEREIYSISAMLRLVLIENISVLCQEIRETEKQWRLADDTVEKWLAKTNADPDRLERLFGSIGKSADDPMDTTDPSFVEHLFYRLRRSGRRYSDILRYIDESLDRFDTSTETMAQKEHDAQAVLTVSMGNCIVSLKHLSSMNWTDLFDAASHLEQILRQDPAQIYSQMDINSRFFYKHTIEKIAKSHGVSELYIAKEALSLARSAETPKDRVPEDYPDVRKQHIGYYIVDDGRMDLEKKQLKGGKLHVKLHQTVSRHQGILYMLSIMAFTGILAFLVFGHTLGLPTTNPILYGILTAAAVLIPMSEIVVSIANWLVCRIKRPAVFPRLDLKDGIPDSMSAVVVIPALLSNKKRVDELMENMENHYLGNRERNLYFALIGAFKDSDFENTKEDKSVVEEASDKIIALNRKYAGGGKDLFYFYNRQRKFNETDQNWTGWERKRGALMEFNELLLGSDDTSFSFYSNELLPDANIKYVITLDADTVLPLGMAKKMIGTMAHPLNKPVIDSGKGIVTKGYGLMQPRVSFDSESSNKSIFSRIYTGQEGLDPYAGAISDVYQDLFGEGIFTGKGIYDLRIFQAVLSGKLPENAILSHDLLEGSFVRAALVSDLELVDSYPSRFNSFMARLHRWVRGDWQLVPWLLGTIHTTDDVRIKNPLSCVSKWKMVDNLRRSLLCPSVLILIVLGFTILPGAGAFWAGLGILSMGLPLILSILAQILTSGFKPDSIKRYLPGFFGIKAPVFQFFLSIIFLPYQAMMALDAIAVSLIRVFITKKNMLEWVTSSDADSAQPNSLKSYFATMGLSAAIGAVIAGLCLTNKPESMVLGLVLLVGWVASPMIAYRISKDDSVLPEALEEKDLLELRKIARKTWRYFEEHADQKNNYLAPDNFQEDPYRGVAYKTSPTNIGLGLMASLTARDMGYIGLIEATERISNTITTLEKMEKWGGHLYNWYDTRTLTPLEPRYVSTVDSGNLVCYLTALEQGLKEYYEKLLIDDVFERGMEDTVRAGLPEESAHTETPKLCSREEGEWIAKSEHMAYMLQQEMESFLPWRDMACAPPAGRCNAGTEASVNALLELMQSNVSLKGLPTLGERIVDQCNSLLQDIGSTEESATAPELIWLNDVKELAAGSIRFSTDFIQRYTQLTERIAVLSMNTRFAALYNERRHLFYIGYNIQEQKPTNSYYDLLASEARQTSYLAIARGEVPPKHWFMLGRSLTVVDRFKGLVSWSGTMFEYLMPLLLMKSYKNTLLDETCFFAVRSQIKYGKQREMPWGASESAYNALDIHHEYQYKAIGVPWLGLKRGLSQDAVIAPYATFLALLVDPKAAWENIRYLKAEGLEGSYGFYEAADYTPDRHESQAKKVIIKSFMAHHQGMSLLAISNYLNHDVMPHRFAKDPYIRSARLLLQEKVPMHVVFTKDSKEKIQTSKTAVYSDKSAYRRYTSPDFDLPGAHILSNGRYFVGLTDKGTGYSQTRDMAISRWRSDPITDNYGTFFYIEDLDKDQNWSAAYAPLNVMPENYEVVFTPDKATYTRTDGDIETSTEVIAASGDLAEVRRIQVKNNGKTPRTMQVTSYVELVAASQESDLAHPAFSNLFVSTEYEPEYNVLLATRRTRSQSDKKIWLACIPVAVGETIGTMEYETDRAQFIGRGNNAGNPDAIFMGKPLSNTVGSVLDPIFSTRLRVRIEPGKTARMYFVTAMAHSRESVMALVEKYSDPKVCKTSFWLATIRSQAEAKYLDIRAPEMELYQDLISQILFLSPQRRKYEQNIKMNRKGQRDLWKYGISGDRPIVLLTLDKSHETELLYELLKAHEYWRTKDLKVDLVVLSREENSYNNPLHSLITEIVHATQTQDVMNRHQDVFLLKTSVMTAEEILLFYAKASMIFEGGRGTLEAQSHAVVSKTADGADDTAEALLQHKDASDYGRADRRADLPFLKHGPGEKQHLQFFNGLGGFADKGKCYVIKLEKNQMTPAPWMNVIANPNFGFMVSESGGGYAWCENSRENKLSKWSNDPIGDEPGEVIYLSEDSKALWSMTPLPIREEEPYVIEHGFGYTAFRHQSHGIRQELVQFVPVADTVKLSLIRLHNESSESRTIRVTYYMTPILGVSMKDTGMHLVSSQSDDGTLLIENPYNREFADRVCFMNVSVKERAVTADRKEFFGQGSFGSPEALKTGSLSGVTGAGYDPCAAMQVSVTLDPNETADIVFAMGMSGSPEEALALADRYRNVTQARDALAEVERFWSDKLQTVQVETPDAAMNIMLNGWLLYQVISCRMWARSGFYQAGGAYGFRDQLQDTLSLVAVWPSLARAQILKHAGHQFEEGDVLHWWHEPSGKGPRTHISDDYLWLPYVTAEYIRVTGDEDILNAKAPYLRGEPLRADEADRYCQPGVSDETFSLYDHCIRSVDNALRFGAHGLPLIRGGDWNDGMNNVGSGGKGESVWLGWFLCATLQKIIPICRARGQEDRADSYALIIDNVADAIEKNGWDGNWYTRAFFDDGAPLGSATNSECKIDSLAQTWSVLSGKGDAQRSAKGMQSLENYLVMEEEGIIKLLTPAFHDGPLEPGYIKGYLPGVRENGGQYTHAAAWVVAAFAALGQGDKAWNCFRLLNPINHARTPRENWLYKVEPYVMAADVYAEQPHIGRGGWTWYTGAAGWMYKAGLESILGLNKQGDKLILAPSFPGKWPAYEIRYKYKETLYHINVTNPNGIGNGVLQVRVDGQIQADHTIMLIDDRRTHQVEVQVGVSP